MPVELSEIVMPRTRPTKVIHFQPMWNVFMRADVPKHFSSTPWLAMMSSDPFQKPDELSRNWLCFYRMYNNLSKFTCNFSVVDPKAHHQFMLEKHLSPTFFRAEDWRWMDTPLTDEQLMPLVSILEVNPHEKAKQAHKFERLVTDAMGHQAAEVRFDPPDFSIDRNLVFGPEHRVIKATSPRKDADVLDLGGTYIGEDDYDDDNLFDDEEDDDIIEDVPTKTTAELKEVKKDEILAVITPAAWQQARLRINNHERIYFRVPEANLSTIARVREKFWSWLQECRNEAMTVGSATDATLEEALDEWNVTGLRFQNEVLERQAAIEKEHEKQVQEAVQKLPIPSQICGDKDPVPVTSSTEDSQTPVVVIDDDQPVANPSSTQSTQDDDEIMEVDTDQAAADAAGRTTISSLIATLGPTANAQVAPEPKKKKVPTKPAESSVLRRLKKQEAARIDCPIAVKYPAVILIQNVESFLVNTSEREIHLGSRIGACKKQNSSVESYQPEHVYNLASPEMPEPKEKRFEVEYSESFQEVNVTAFEDLPFSEKSKCWNTAFSCRVKITDKRSLNRLMKKLDNWELCCSDYQSVTDMRFSKTAPTQLYHSVDTSEFQRTFDKNHRIDEDQELCAFGMRATESQLGIALA